MNFKRRAHKLTIDNFELSGLSITFKVTKSLKPEPNTCNLKIFGLSETHRRQLETSKAVPVRLEAGYKNALIVVDVRRIRETDVNEVFVHELWHVKLSPYTEFANNFVDGHDGGPISGHIRVNEERLVTELTRTLLWR